MNERILFSDRGDLPQPKFHIRIDNVGELTSCLAYAQEDFELCYFYKDTRDAFSVTTSYLEWVALNKAFEGSIEIATGEIPKSFQNRLYSDISFAFGNNASVTCDKSTIVVAYKDIFVINIDTEHGDEDDALSVKLYAEVLDYESYDNQSDLLSSFASHISILANMWAKIHNFSNINSTQPAQNTVPISLTIDASPFYVEMKPAEEALLLYIAETDKCAELARAIGKTEPKFETDFDRDTAKTVIDSIRLAEPAKIVSTLDALLEKKIRDYARYGEEPVITVEDLANLFFNQPTSSTGADD